MNVNENTVSLDDLLLRNRPHEIIDRSTYSDDNCPKPQDLLKGSSLTLNHLLNWPPCIFAFGEGFEAVYQDYEKINIKWVAKRGSISDWAVYFGPSDWSWDYILKMGTKLRSSELIKKLVKCDFESFEMYRK